MTQGKAKRFRAWTRKAPIITGFIILGIYFGLNTLSANLKLLAGTGFFGVDGSWTDFSAQIIDIVWPLILVIAFGYLWIYARKGFWKVFALATPMIIFFIVQFLSVLAMQYLVPSGGWQTMPMVILGVVILFGVGFREESLFRGIVATGIGMKYGKTRGGIWFSVFMSGLIFGLLHVINLLAGMDPSSVIVQVTGAVGIGMFLTAVYYRGANIWGLMLLHALTNLPGLFAVLFTKTEMTGIDALNSMNVFSLIIVAVQVALTAFLLRGSKIQEIKDNLESMEKTNTATLSL